MSASLLQSLGGEASCKRLSSEFYARVANDPVLRPLFPGKSLKCAIDEFAAFLIQFLGGDEDQTQRRWWLSLRESHARFKIDAAQRAAWLKHMGATLDSTRCPEETRHALRQFFLGSSSYVIGKEAAASEHEELEERWNAQRSLDDAVAAIAAGRDAEAIVLADRYVARPAIFVGLLARMIASQRPALISFAIHTVQRDPSLGTRRFARRTLLHYAAAAGCLQLVNLLLRSGIDPNLQDGGGHTPLYSVANQCPVETGPDIVRALISAGADVNASGGVTRATSLHMAARRGHTEIARALLECGANIDARDTKGDTALQRAINCRRHGIAELLRMRGAFGKPKL